MTYTHSVMEKHHGKRHGKCHRKYKSLRSLGGLTLHCDTVTMTSSKAERQRRHIARINADPQKREEFLIKDRLRKKNMAMTYYTTKHDYRKEPAIQRMQLNNKSNAEFLNQALTYRG